MSLDEMKVDPQRASQLASNISAVLSTVKAASSSSSPTRLIAVSKLKPASDILALTQPPANHQHFGENYLQELQQKAPLLPSSIKWSFIGGLQSNKCSALAQIPNLWAVNSVDSAKKVDALQRGRSQWLDSDAGKARLASWTATEAEDRRRIRVFVQVNTSGEQSKSGVEPGKDVVDLCRHVMEQSCLVLQGVMTIGAIARSQAAAQGEENEDFVVLKRERDEVARELGLKEEELELSMGMSADFEEAIRMGSAEVRVGSTIFGERPPKSDAHV